MEVLWLIASIASAFVFCYRLSPRHPWLLFALIVGVPYFCLVLMGVLSGFLDQAQGRWEVLDLIATVLLALMTVAPIGLLAYWGRPANRRHGPRV